MERNDFSPEVPASGQAGGSTAGGGFGNTANVSGSQGFAAGTSANADVTMPNQAGTQGHGLAERARNVAGTAQEKLADVGSTVRERAGTLKDSLADALDSGADRLRHRGGQSGLATATDIGSVAVPADGRTTQVTTRVAGGMEATADWLRQTDLDSMKLGIERQVKEHPGRTLLVAVGLGYLLGKAFRSK
jgi:ElaB/YqjD/DUF883 family membrane-anchored ribosome-binding protein